MATNNPRGLRPTRHLNGGSHFRSRRFSVSANNPTAIFPGEPVELLADGHVRRIQTSAVSANERGIVGIVRAVYNSQGRPLTHNLPDTGHFIPASTAGWVEVVDDPDVVFLANSDATADQTMIGQYVRVTAGSANTAAGISGFSVKLADATASSVGHRFMIYDIAAGEKINDPDGLTGANTFANNQDVEIVITDHHYRRPFRRVGQST